MTWARWLLGVAAVVGAAACGTGGDRLPELVTVGGELLHGAAVEPLPGSPPVEPTPVRSKSARPYVAAVGVVRTVERPGRDTVVAALRQSGFSVARTEADTVTAVRGDLVAEFTLSARLGEREAAAGTTLVALRLASRDPQLGWTQV